MAIIDLLINFLFHPLTYVVPMADSLNSWIYFILFIWIFLETAFIFFSFLPGQSVLFLTSTVAASETSHLNIIALFLIFVSSATLGAMVKYYYGLTMDSRNHIAKKINNSDQMSQTEDFFDQHADNSLLFARFIPFIGLFVPIIAGTSQMNWRRFNLLNFAGVLIWVGTCCFIGYYFGNTPFIKKYFTIIFTLLAIVPTLSGVLFRYYRQRQAA
ncbi:hypothetical protein PECL_1483 [Pediococcus claussenii ATCC BAA-344]|uniref:VTT domain-containing protein n=2 Tax=Pediococcus claussenii TaxID=187452 RepID=G8PF28_PEDCP|nr:hypothetical protein PECL_1483 [Pediococcus claussenii ATCC BAA-344]